MKQRAGTGPRGGGLLPVSAACLSMALMPACAWAQAQARSGLSITPIVSAQETFTDNVTLSNDNKRSDFATQGSVGLRATSNTGRVRGSVDYTLTGILHSSQAVGNQNFNALNANVTGEILANHLYVDLLGNISQQSLSAFGQQSVDNTTSNANRTEVSIWSISPYLRGNLTPAVNYEIRANAGRTSASSNQSTNSTTVGGLVHLGSALPGLFGWSLDANHQTVRYTVGSEATSQVYRGTLTYNLNSDIALTLIGGRESNNYLTPQTKSYSDVGGQASWNPSKRTSLLARYEHRYFGNSHQVQFNYRTPLSAWSFIDGRDVTTSRVPTGGLVQVLSPLYQLLYQVGVATAQSQGVAVDPVEIDRAVRLFLFEHNESPTVTVGNFFLTSQVILQRTQSLSFSLIGSRSTLVFRVAKNNSSGLGNQPIFNGGLVSSNVINQKIAAVDYIYKLNANTNLGSTLSIQRNAGDVGALTNTLKGFYLNLNTRVTPRDSLGGGLRHVIFDSRSQPYTENAVFATYSHSF